jgi:hypothetical protein
MNRRELMLLLSGAATCPIAARAQQRAMPARIGWLVTGSIDSPEQRVAIEVWRQALGELGYVEGKNIVSDYRAADNRLERLPELARELVELKVDLIVAGRRRQALPLSRPPPRSRSSYRQWAILSVTGWSQASRGRGGILPAQPFSARNWCQSEWGSLENCSLISPALPFSGIPAHTESAR